MSADPSALVSIDDFSGLDLSDNPGLSTDQIDLTDEPVNLGGLTVTGSTALPTDALPVLQPTTITTPGMSVAQTAAMSGQSNESVLGSLESFALSASALAKLPASSIAGVSPSGGVVTTSASQIAAAASLAQQQQSSTTNKNFLTYVIIAIVAVVVLALLFKKRG